MVDKWWNSDEIQSRPDSILAKKLKFLKSDVILSSFTRWPKLTKDIITLTNLKWMENK